MRKASRRSGKAKTALDVAILANVSPMTVSRVINGEENVRDSTRAAVRAAIEQLGYKPNLAAKNLARAVQPRIGLPFLNPSRSYLFEFLVGMFDEVREVGAEVTIIRDLKNEQAAIEQLIEARVSGVLLTSPLGDSVEVRQKFAAAEIPVVVVGSGHFLGDVSCVRIDEHKAAYEMTSYLIGHGHQNIGFIAGDPNQSASAARLNGFKDALRDLAPRANNTIVQGYFTYSSGLKAAQELIDRENRPTAIFASNDDMAAAVVSLAHRRGLDVPKDITVAGFDDTESAVNIWPELTTVNQPIALLAKTAVDVLMRDIRTRRMNSEPRPTDRILPHRLIPRASAPEA